MFAKQKYLSFCQTLNDVILRLLLVVFVNMNHGEILCRERCSDQFASMAVLRLSFATHESNTLLLSKGCLETFNSPLIDFGILYLFVIHLPFRIITSFVIRVPAQRVAHKHIPDPVLLQLHLQSLFGEFGFIARIGS